ncbi:MAG: hypothetical protein WA755_16815 [Candidatus Acidiferrales bacterium]
MSRNQFVRLSALLLTLALMIPVAASLASAKDSKGTAKADIEIVNTVTFGSTELKAGEYSFVADGTKVQAKRNGKVVAEAPIQWQDRKEKSESSSIVLEGNQVKEIRFNGQTRTAIVQP